MEIKILEEAIKTTNLTKVRLLKIELPQELEIFNRIIGVDPGTVNLGVAVIQSYTKAELFQVKIDRSKNPVERIKTAQFIMYDLIEDLILPTTLIVEGAGYMSSIYRQAELAETRAAIALWGIKHNMNVQILPPNTIRKRAFGKGKTRADSVWTNIPPDCAAALSCCYAFSTGT